MRTKEQMHELVLSVVEQVARSGDVAPRHVSAALKLTRHEMAEATRRAVRLGLLRRRGGGIAVLLAVTPAGYELVRSRIGTAPPPSGVRLVQLRMLAGPGLRHQDCEHYGECLGAFVRHSEARRAHCAEDCPWCGGDGCGACQDSGCSSYAPTQLHAVDYARRASEGERRSHRKGG